MVDFYTRQEKLRVFYFNTIIKLYEDILRNVNKDEEPLQIVNSILEISQSYDFNKYVDNLTSSIINKVEVENAKDWREAVFKSYKPNEFYKQLLENTSGQIAGILTNQRLENAQLIKTVPSLFAQKATEYAEKAYMEGRRAGDVKNEILNMYGELTEYQAARIARTELSKTSSSLVQVRSQAVGLNWYIWKTAKDRRVRHSHDIMEGVLCNFNNPPNPEKLAGEKRDYGVYNAGNIFWCRCYPSPIVDYRDISFPAKVCYNGQIVRMNKTQFLEIA